MRRIDHPDVPAIARALRERRIQLGFSRETLAGQVGLSWEAINKMERGERIPSLGIVCRLAEALDMKIGLGARAQ